MGILAGGDSLNLTKAKNDVLDFMDSMYKNVGKKSDVPFRHLEIRSIYAYLSRRYPSAYMEDCFQLVQDLCEFCGSDESVFPYPDGDYWTDSEVEKYVSWRKGWD